jgi:hypothetical protein
VLPAPWLLALGLVVGLLVLIPAQRLRLGGYAPRTIGLYTVVLWALAMLLIVRPIGGRLLAPLVLIGYLAPFVGAPGEVRRAIDRRRPRAGSGRPPMRNVTPPDADAAVASRPADPPDPPDSPDREDEA